MGENAELYVLKGNERMAIESWLIKHKVNYDERCSTEELIELYRNVECGGVWLQMKITQKQRIINYIREFGYITSWQAYQDLGIM